MQTRLARRFAASIAALVGGLLAGGATVGCKEPLGDCTTAISVENQSTSNRSYDIVIDGVGVGVVEVGSKRSFNVAPGRHTVQIRFANTATTACSASEPVVEECRTFGLICRG